MGMCTKILILFAIFFIVSLFIAVISHKKKFDEWLDPRWYIQNLLKGFNILIFALMGVPAYIKSNKPINRADTYFIKVSKELHEKALAYAAKQMEAGDMVYHNGDEKRKTKDVGTLGYCRRLFDCENFAYALKHYYDLYIALETTTLGKGIPSMVVGYTTHKGEGHNIVEFIVDEVIVWHDSYPINGTFKQLHLDDNEKATLHVIGMG